ncbi:hypothetical protein COV19_00470 [Candidatus Woesearchaeota archaeon CG10_big_fil_rev_8_21_14_0_10_44_13]|nr:MAG: hypothetical protein COV19_00470 [Candidatus Woesearchaeota archaeon CG10_big_fil_rev_8_21_14_0_10_44_13]
MTIRIYIAVQGTCTAGPDENIMQILTDIEEGRRKREFSQKLGREVTGGGTVLWVRSSHGIYMIDSGDFADREILGKSLETIAREERCNPVKYVRSIYHGHSHPDHNGNNDMFRNSYWMADENDKLLDVVLGPNDSKRFNNFRRFYEGHRQRDITSSKFIRYRTNHHAGRPLGLKIYDAEGHAPANKAFTIEDREGIVMVNLETGEEYRTGRIVFAGDSICDKRYLKMALKKDPEMQRAAVYGSNIPTKDWQTDDVIERAALDQAALQSIMRIIEEARKGGLMVFGHGGVYDINASTKQASENGYNKPSK